MLVQVDWSASQPRNPSHTAVRSNHLDSAPFRVVVGLPTILSSDGDRCIMFLTAPELRALGGTTWTASLSLLLGSLHAASVVHLRRWELRRAGLQLTQKKESRMENIMYNAYLDIPMVSFFLHQHLVHLDCGKSMSVNDNLQASEALVTENANFPGLPCRRDGAQGRWDKRLTVVDVDPVNFFFGLRLLFLRHC